jgi:predicted house-cleaning noncanonical NTP pyrophosphatase (MazG superfamily)
VIKTFDKLVRDNLPDILHKDANVRDFSYTYITDDKLNEYVRNKLVEEATEVLNATSQKEVLAELGDLYEIMIKVATANGIKPHEIIHAASTKASKYGTFNKNIILKEIIYK